MYLPYNWYIATPSVTWDGCHIYLLCTLYLVLCHNSQSFAGLSCVRISRMWDTTSLYKQTRIHEKKINIPLAWTYKWEKTNIQRYKNVKKKKRQRMEMVLPMKWVLLRLSCDDHQAQLQSHFSQTTISSRVGNDQEINFKPHLPESSELYIKYACITYSIWDCISLHCCYCSFYLLITTWTSIRCNLFLLTYIARANFITWCIS